LGGKKKNTWEMIQIKEKRTYVAETFVHDKKVTYRTNTVEIYEYILSLSKSTYVVVIIILVYIYIYICFVDRSNEERRARVVVY